MVRRATAGLVRPGRAQAAAGLVRLGQCAWIAAGLSRGLLCPGCRTPGAPGLSQHLGDFAGPVGKYRVGAGAENA